MKSKKHEINKDTEKRMNHNGIIIEEGKKLCFKLNKGISMGGLIWSNKKNQNDDFNQGNKVKLLWREISDFYEEKKSNFHTNCFLTFKAILISVH